MKTSDIIAITTVIFLITGAFAYEKITRRPEIPAEYRKCVQDTLGDFLYCERYRGPR